jgi:shikimate kinase
VTASKQGKNIYLVGPMGVGKTSVGRLLAQVLGREFVDTDRLIEERTGADIPWIFDVEGEQGFRDREAQVITELESCSGLVIATGGGAILREENRQSMRRGGHVIYLRVAPDVLFRRLAGDKTRPLLQKDNPRAAIRKIVEERSGLYEAVASLVIDTHTGPVWMVLKKVLSALEEMGFWETKV